MNNVEEIVLLDTFTDKIFLFTPMVSHLSVLRRFTPMISHLSVLRRFTPMISHLSVLRH